jgi:hypothetical protein
MRLPPVGLVVDTTAARPVQPGDFEITAVSHDGTEPAQTLWLIAFVREGWLTSLELAYLDTIPRAFPPVDTFAAPTISG